MNFFANLKLRFLLGGGIVTVIGIVLLFIRVEIGIVLIVIGIVAFLIGLIWKPKKKKKDNQIN
jgi:ABC-type bacteriocin/lantibiotic exporter with double-glycine peptidase domain